MRAPGTRLEIQPLEERLLAGSYFGSPAEDGGLTSPLAAIPRRRMAIALIKSMGPQHPRTQDDAAGTAPSSPDHRQSVLGTPAPSGAVHAGTISGTVSIAAVTAAGLARTAGSTSIVTSTADPSLTLVSTDLNVGFASPSGANISAATMGAASSSTAGSPTNPVPATSGLGSVAPAGATSVSTTPPVAANPASVSVSQNTVVVNSLGLGGPGGNSPPPTTSDGLTIPQGHPRIWFNADPQRLAQAQAYYAQNPINPASDDVVGQALVYVLTGNPTAAAAAINTLMNFTISDAELQGVASDTYRWNGWVPVVYDWVHDAMTPDQRQTLTDRYNYYASTMMNKSWGGPTMPGNNYFWGYFANELNWAIATYYENPMAQTFLDDTLITRWQNSFLPWAASTGLGGIFAEGSEYGKADLAYPALPLTTAALMGGTEYGQTNFYKEAVFNLIYSTTPGPTYSKESPANPYYMPFPFGEEEHDGGYPNINDSTAYGDFMQAAAAAYSNLPVGQYAYQYLQTVQPSQTGYTAPNYLNTPTYQSGVATPDYHRLPVDYYAPGVQYLYTRNQWGPQATSVFLQLGQTEEGHNNLDAGSFQIWRNGWFVSKNSTGYDLQFNGGMSEDPIAQNTLLFGGQGIAPSWRVSDPQVIRLQSAPAFSYAAVDMSQAFQSSYATLSNPYAAHAVREFIFVKPLETMVILDRLESSDTAEPAQDVTKTFLLHFPNQPQVTGTNSVIGYSGDQALRLTTLVPSNPSYNVVDESNVTGQHDPDPAFYQYRLEENTSGSAQSYFLNVLQARDANGDNVVSHMTQNATSWTITLDSPTQGHAEITLNKGMDSQGGAVGYSATGTPTEFTPLLDHVQGIQVTDYGPVWGS